MEDIVNVIVDKMIDVVDSMIGDFSVIITREELCGIAYALIAQDFKGEPNAYRIAEKAVSTYLDAEW